MGYLYFDQKTTMINLKRIEQFARQIHQAIPRGIREFSDDIEKKILQLIQAQLTRMDLINREEFDIQTELLLRTREKLTTLEQRLIVLEEKNKVTVSTLSVKTLMTKSTPADLRKEAEAPLQTSRTIGTSALPIAPESTDNLKTSDIK